MSYTSANNTSMEYVAKDLVHKKESMIPDKID